MKGEPESCKFDPKKHIKSTTELPIQRNRCLSEGWICIGDQMYGRNYADYLIRNSVHDID